MYAPPAFDSFPASHYPRISYSRRAEAAMIVKVVIKQGEDGFFVAHCPSLRSCWSQGKTREEALDNIRKAVALYLESPSQELTQDESQEVVELSL
jgi:predicted RNase H-like HicB family nuclease